MFRKQGIKLVKQSILIQIRVLEVLPSAQIESRVYMSGISAVVAINEFFSDAGDGIVGIVLESESCVVSVDVRE
jgi:hypothetical protein